MKKIIAVVSLATLLITAATSSNFNNNSVSVTEDESSNIRTVQYDNEFNIEDDSYKSTKLENTSFGFIFTAVKSFNSSLFENIDLVGETTSDEIDVTYEAKYYEAEGRVTLDVYEVNDDLKTKLIDTIEGLITTNSLGEPDVIFADGDETIFLSQLIEETALDNVGWWDSFCNWITGVVNTVKEVIVSGLRLLTKISVKIIGLDGAASLLNMTKDSNGIYHADFNCWQQYAGYNDFYDFVFNLGSKMSSTKNDFYDQDGDGDTDYILWGWKGDYWELGYGAELGIYKRLGNSELWYVDKNLAIDMTLKVDYRTSTSSSWKNIIDWNPAKAEGYSSKQWWITGFNPAYANKKISSTRLLRATYTVKFITKGYSSSFDTALKNSFKSKYVDSMRRWTFNSASSTFTYSFI